jgi:hypothetical protein
MKIMINTKQLHPEYITDENGIKKSVVLSIVDFQELIEQIEDLVAVAERRNEPAISHEKLLEELKKDG